MVISIQLVEGNKTRKHIFNENKIIKEKNIIKARREEKLNKIKRENDSNRILMGKIFSSSLLEDIIKIILTTINNYVFTFKSINIKNENHDIYISNNKIESNNPHNQNTSESEIDSDDLQAKNEIKSLHDISLMNSNNAKKFFHNKSLNYKIKESKMFGSKLDKGYYTFVIAAMVFSSLLSSVKAKGLCSNLTSPSNVTECLKYSTQDYFCCYITIQDSPSNFSACYAIDKDTASSSVIQIGKLTYMVDCTGIPDYYKYFPFEEKFQACSIDNPKTIDSCTSYEMEGDQKCCMGLVKSYPDLRKCYSTIGITSNLVNYTTSYGDELTLICSAEYFNINFLFFLFYLISIFFIIL